MNMTARLYVTLAAAICLLGCNKPAEPATDKPAVKTAPGGQAASQRQFMKDLGFRGIGEADALPMPQRGSDLITSPASERERLVQRGRRALWKLRGQESTLRRIPQKRKRACGRFSLGRIILRGLQTGTLGKQQAQGGLTVILAHGGLKVGGGQILGMGLMRAPLQEEAVADAPEQPGHKHGVRMANAATVVIMGNVQTLVQAVFDAAKARAVELQPLLGVELMGLGAGNEANVLILAALGLAQ
jgi:hypothetical protein